ncbi:MULTISPECIES: hypothetical protein [Prauserella]|uniref:Uncharacterized protein n=4 Tax=Prauserella TaxID=142577 RepID=A0A839RVN9_9PSEU|nr:MULTISPECIES: hypothetical protein [Prauserella]MBB3049134.1 hypothetical protein [Prauserella isguenensis]MBB3662127.1 hypothetical protein [Prauserella sediminis]MCP2182526.1 hypothetical protein [Prauserella alba]MCP2253065.1 hypothetical protein [Prauserella aidingensis]MCR3719818.1 hypothetical protein [Prauserella flava]
MTVVRTKRRAMRAGVGSRRNHATSPKSLYARPMALRELYSDAGTIIRRGQQEAAAAADEKHSR